ncbi:hypothetical protein [Desulforhopalus sp. 52FAK]
MNEKQIKLLVPCTINEMLYLRFFSVAQWRRGALMDVDWDEFELRNLVYKRL